MLFLIENMKIKNLAVFCGSKAGHNPLYMAEATLLGNSMAANGIGLVYGGGGKGLMGAIADAVLLAGGSVIGVIPKILLEWEAQHKGVNDLRVVNDMHERKKLLYELCDAALVLPGGNGTLDELFEMLTWNTLKIHNKKIILLNCDGYYNHLIAHINAMFEQGFLYDDWRERLIVCSNANEVIAFFD